MNKTINNFITTSDFDTYRVLKSEGFQLVYSTDKTWTFINEPNKLSFDNKKVAYTNNLCI